MCTSCMAGQAHDLQHSWTWVANKDAPASTLALTLSNLSRGSTRIGSEPVTVSWQKEMQPCDLAVAGVLLNALLPCRPLAVPAGRGL